MLNKLVITAILFVFYLGNLAASEIVNVGGYIFPPFVEKDKTGKISGMTLDLINSINKMQNEYQLKFVLTSSRRRYASFEQGEFDIIFFENLLWGWQKSAIEASRIFLQGGEVFIALKSTAKQQSYFDSLNNKSISAMLGYHYNFANYNSDPEYLRKNFDIHLSSDEKNNIQLVLLAHMDIAIVTKSYLDKFLIEFPSAKEQLLISNKMDQRYQHSILIRKDSHLSVAKMNSLLNALEESGEYQLILDKYGIKE